MAGRCLVIYCVLWHHMMRRALCARLEAKGKTWVKFSAGQLSYQLEMEGLKVWSHTFDATLQPLDCHLTTS
jgi:hypothetical protein